MRNCDKKRVHDAIDDALETTGITNLKCLHERLKEHYPSFRLSYASLCNYINGRTKYNDLEDHVLKSWISEELKMPIEVVTECITARTARSDQRKRKTKVVDKSVHNGTFVAIPDLQHGMVQVDRVDNVYIPEAVKNDIINKFLFELVQRIDESDLMDLLYGHVSRETYEAFYKIDRLCYEDGINLRVVISSIINSLSNEILNGKKEDPLV